MKVFLLTSEFWVGAGERSVRAFAWAFLAALGVPKVSEGVGFDVVHAGWPDALSYGAGAAVLSLMFSVAAGRLAGPAGSPSLVDDRPVRHAVSD
jgi:hypothetical protein